MTVKKADLIEEIMKGFGYNNLDAEARVRIRQYYSKMTVADLNYLNRKLKENSK